MKAIVIILVSTASYYFTVGNDKAALQQNSVSANPIEIPVGTIINDSTASITVNNSLIQRSIIPKIDVLQNANITSTPAVISIGNSSCYLVFEAMAITAKKILVAVELTKVGNSVMFRKETGKKIHIWETTGNCTPGNIYHNRQENYISCACALYPDFESRVGCYHLLFIIS